MAKPHIECAYPINKILLSLDVTAVAAETTSGNFAFSELLPVAQNALGSIYTNYKPYKVAKNQFLDFNFTLYNQIVNVFFHFFYYKQINKYLKGFLVPNPF